MTAETFLNGKVTLHAGDSRDVLKKIADNSIDSIVTDPPYALVSIVKRFGGENAAAVKVPEGGTGAYARASAGFMGKTWDTGETAFSVEFWAEVLRVLKPGGHVAAFGASRGYHRMACAIEDAGFEIRDSLMWIYGSGFPKSHDIAKQIDKQAGYWRGRAGDVIESTVGQVAKGTEYERADKGDPITAAAAAWEGWGTALKPAHEPICLARKPLSEKTVAANVLRWGTGALNIDGCRVPTDENLNGGAYAKSGGREMLNGDDRIGASAGMFQPGKTAECEFTQPPGRWPANVMHDGSDEVIGAFPQDTSSFFYSAKADADDRLGSKHPTVKPVDLKQHLCRLVTPGGGTVLDPFAGTGTTGEAAFREGFNAILIEREPEYQDDIRRRMALVMAGPDERKRESIKAKIGEVPFGPDSLFAGVEAAE